MLTGDLHNVKSDGSRKLLVSREGLCSMPVYDLIVLLLSSCLLCAVVDEATPRGTGNSPP